MKLAKKRYKFSVKGTTSLNINQSWNGEIDIKFKPKDESEVPGIVTQMLIDNAKEINITVDRVILVEIQNPVYA